METITQETLMTLLKEALTKLYVKDWYILEHNCHERSITHKLAEYLQELLPNYDVDCEYNLDIDNENKRKKWISKEVITKIKSEIKNIKGNLDTNNWNLSEEIEKLSKGFYPDIIVHKRDTNKYNMLVIEVKKSNNIDTELDIQKLIALTSQNTPNHYKYLLGAQITVDVGTDLVGREFTNPRFFINGIEI